MDVLEALGGVLEGLGGVLEASWSVLARLSGDERKRAEGDPRKNEDVSSENLIFIANQSL